MIEEQSKSRLAGYYFEEFIEWLVITLALATRFLKSPFGSRDLDIAVDIRDILFNEFFFFKFNKAVARVASYTVLRILLTEFLLQPDSEVACGHKGTQVTTAVSRELLILNYGTQRRYRC